MSKREQKLQRLVDAYFEHKSVHDEAFNSIDELSCGIEEDGPSTSTEEPTRDAKRKLSEHKKTMKKSLAEMSKIAKRLKSDDIDIERYCMMKAIEESEANIDLQATHDCGKKLDEMQRDNMGTSHNGEPTLPVEEEAEDDSTADVLDESAAPLANDDGYNTLRYYDESRDAQDMDVALRIETGSAVNAGSVQILPALANELKPHQKDAVKCALHEIGVARKGFLLAHSMGLGKTFTTIALLDALNRCDDKFKAVVVCPCSLTGSWYSELGTWSHSFRYHPPLLDARKALILQHWKKDGGVLIMGYDRFRIIQEADKTLLDMSLLVVDEAHELKNPKTKLYGAVQSAATPCKLLLTGSPLQNHLMEYFAMIQLIQPGFFEEKDFKKNFARIIDRGAMADASAAECAEARVKIRAFTDLTERFIHRRSVAVLAHSLPPMLDYKLTYTVPGIANAKADTNVIRSTQEAITASMPMQVDLACSLLTAILKTGEQILVFGNRIEVLEQLHAKHAGILMTGKTGNRQGIVESFQNGEIPILYMTTDVGSTGFNLFKASRVLILDPSWNPVNDCQACFRAYRYGQTRRVVVYRFIAKDSVQERIYRCAVHKHLAACRINDLKDVERHFTAKQLKEMDDYQEEHLAVTEDDALNSVLHRFDSCSSHDILFAEANSEQLTKDERADAANYCNLCLLKQPHQRTLEKDGEWVTVASTDIHFPQSDVLLPPLTPAYHKYDEQSKLIFHELQPNSEVLDTFTIEAQLADRVETFDVKASKVTQLWTHPQLQHAKQIRCCASVGHVKSAWSAWSVAVP